MRKKVPPPLQAAAFDTRRDGVAFARVDATAPRNGRLADAHGVVGFPALKWFDRASVDARDAPLDAHRASSSSSAVGATRIATAAAMGGGPRAGVAEAIAAWVSDALHGYAEEEQLREEQRREREERRTDRLERGGEEEGMASGDPASSASSGHAASAPPPASSASGRASAGEPPSLPSLPSPPSPPSPAPRRTQHYVRRPIRHTRSIVDEGSFDAIALDPDTHALVAFVAPWCTKSQVVQCSLSS